MKSFKTIIVILLTFNILLSVFNRVAINNIDTGVNNAFDSLDAISKDMRILTLGQLISSMDVSRINKKLGFEDFQYDDLPENLKK